MRWLRLWFGFSEPVNRRAYVVSGAGLLLFKYAADAALVWTYSGRLWSPANYLRSVSLLRERVLLGVSPGVMLALALWTLPFLWIGFGMSVRRAADAGRSAWWALLFFVPVLNYVLMVTLSLLPTAAVPEWRRTAPVPVMSDRLKSGLLGIAASLAITIPSVLIGVYLKKSYSAGLFLGTPFSIGYISAHVFNHRHARTVGRTIEVVLIALGLAAGALLLFAAEGAFCLALAFPLAAVVAVCGGLFGRAIALHGAEPPFRTGMAAAFAPLLVLAEPRASAPAHEVLSVVEIAARPDVVWRHVVSFADLPRPGEWLFRIGVAAPVRARMEGTGVGAVRYCDFTTGSFVEPVTAWEENRVLAFDIVRQAPPMREWSPYRDVNPPHLDGYFRATHGEFRLTPLPDGRTRLEGRTTYAVAMFPQSYWTLPAGRIVAAIHARVLRHIKVLAEEEHR